MSQTQQQHRCFSTWCYLSPSPFSLSLTLSLSLLLLGSTKAQQVAGSPIDFDFPFSLNVYAIAVKAQFPFPFHPPLSISTNLHLFCLPNPINAGDFHYNNNNKTNATNLQHHCKLIDFYVQRVFLFPLSEIADTLWQQQHKEVSEREREKND